MLRKFLIAAFSVLLSAAAAADNSFVMPGSTLPAGPRKAGGGSSFISNAQSGNYTTSSSDNGKCIAVTTGSGADVTITLAVASTAADGALQCIQKVDSGSKKVIVSDGSTRAWLSNQWDLIVFRSNASVWEPFHVTITPRVDTYSATGGATWTQPPLAAAVFVQAWAAGGGSGSGNRAAVSTNKSGGSGGGGGSRFEKWFNAADVGATENLSVGTGGTAGAAQTVDDTPGNAGGNGGNTTFGTTIKIQVNGGKAGAGGLVSVAGGTGGAVWGIAGPNLTGNPSTSSPNAMAFEGGLNTSGAVSGNALWGGGAGAGSSFTTGDSAGGSSVYGCGGGGGAGGEASGNTFQAATAGGATYSYTVGGGGAAGTSSAGSPTAGTAGASIGVGGGGGGASQTVAASAGGAGGVCGGGGGGGSSRDGFNSGAGAVGGNGQVIVTTYFQSM